MERFSESYLDEVTSNQGILFDIVSSEYPNKDTADFIDSYMKSKTRRWIDEGQAYLCTLEPTRLLDFFLKTEGYSFKDGESLGGFMPLWTGEFYARYQWEKEIPSAEVIERIPFSFIRKAYGALHDLDLGEAVRKVG